MTEKEIMIESLCIARLNCRHEFTGELLEDGSALHMQVTYTCVKCKGKVRFSPYDRNLMYD